MVTLTLIRLVERSSGTFGELLEADTSVLIKTLELVWRFNANLISCIPIGTYECKRVFNRPKHPECFEVMNVPHRSAILFHKANTIKDLRGCIGVGLEHDANGIKPGTSGPGYEKFMHRLKDEWKFKLVIKGE